MIGYPCFQDRKSYELELEREECGEGDDDDEAEVNNDDATNEIRLVVMCDGEKKAFRIKKTHPLQVSKWDNGVAASTSLGFGPHCPPPHSLLTPYPQNILLPTCQKLINAFAQHKNMTVDQLKFLFDGEVLDPNDTAVTLDLEDDDLIDCQVVKS